MNLEVFIPFITFKLWKIYVKQKLASKSRNHQGTVCMEEFLVSSVGVLPSEETCSWRGAKWSCANYFSGI